jgi:hypothetical protein
MTPRPAAIGDHGADQRELEQHRAGRDEGLLPFFLSPSCLYGESILEEHILVPNDIVPS